MTEDFMQKRADKINARTYEQDLERLRELDKQTDYEDSHYEADEIITKYIPKEMKELYDKLGKWYA